VTVAAGPYAPADDGERIKAIVLRLKQAGLQVQRLASLDGLRVLLKLRAPQHVLEAEAAKVNLSMRQHDGLFAPFSSAAKDSFVGAGYGGRLFRSGDRQVCACARTARRASR
jgi:hypothetical protein